MKRVVKGFFPVCAWVLALCFSTQFAQADMTQCRFHFGRPYAGGIPKEVIQQVDYLSVWAGSSQKYNMGGFLKACKTGGAYGGVTPVVYDYIIAFTLRSIHGLQDCNVGTPNLCQDGARYLRNAQDKAKILSVLAEYARGAAQDWGTKDPIIWLMEPDFYQYAQPGSQGGNPLSFTEASKLMNEMLDTISTHLPNALFSLDISPWTTDQGQTRNYYTSFDLKRFTFMNTSGGQARPDGPVGSTTISRNNKMTYKEIFELTGKPIITDCGYGVGGASEGYVAAWDDANNINNRIADGVIAISQNNPNNASWGGILANVRPKINEPKICPQVVSLSRDNRGLRLRAAQPLSNNAVSVDILGRPFFFKNQRHPKAFFFLDGK